MGNILNIDAENVVEMAMADKVEMHPTLVDSVMEALAEEAVQPYRELANDVAKNMMDQSSDIAAGLQLSHLHFGAACAHAERLKILDWLERAPEDWPFTGEDIIAMIKAGMPDWEFTEDGK